MTELNKLQGFEEKLHYNFSSEIEKYMTKIGFQTKLLVIASDIWTGHLGLHLPEAVSLNDLSSSNILYPANFAYNCTPARHVINISPF